MIFTHFSGILGSPVKLHCLFSRVNVWTPRTQLWRAGENREVLRDILNQWGVRYSCWRVVCEFNGYHNVNIFLVYGTYIGLQFALLNPLSHCYVPRLFIYCEMVSPRFDRITLARGRYHHVSKNEMNNWWQSNMIHVKLIFPRPAAII